MTREQFKTQVLSLQNKLFRYALSIVAERELAKDIVQEVLMKLWDERERLDQIKQLEAWCIRLTRNKAFDKLRLHANRVVELKPTVHEGAYEAIPDRSFENQDLVENIQVILKILPEKQREIFRLRDLLGYSNKEIEDILDLDDMQVKVNLCRARKKIRVKLNQLINYGLENEKTAS